MSISEDELKVIERQLGQTMEESFALKWYYETVKRLVGEVRELEKLAEEYHRFMQDYNEVKLAAQKVSWDESLPQDVRDRFRRIVML